MLLKLRAIEWLLRFIKNRLDQLNNKHMKTAVNLTTQFLQSRYKKKYLVKVWSFLPNHRKMMALYIFCEIERKPSLVYWKCTTWTEYDLPIINSVCEKVWFTINGLWKMLFFLFLPFSFFKISNDYCQKPYGENILFYNGFRGFSWSSTTSQIFLNDTLLTIKRRPF